jgi:hypothetical protein
VRTGVAACAVAALFASTAVRAADERAAKLDYALYIGGFETIRVSFETKLRAADYKMKMALNGKGILDWWFSWTMSAYSEGQLADGDVIPVRAGAHSAWNGKRRELRLSYSGDGPPQTVIRPVPDGDDRDDVPLPLRAGTRDLAGAVLAALSRLNQAERCSLSEPVFDGRRRYNLVLEHLGREELTRTDYSVFSGPALRCRLEIDRVAGFRKNPGRQWSESDSATVWIGHVSPNFPPVPVRLGLDTTFGAVRAHLVGATITEGGKTWQLAAAP